MLITAATPAPSAAADGAAPAAPDSAHAPASGLEMLHLTPAGQPPLDQVDEQTLGEVRKDFNASSDRVRMLLLLSPSCPHCLHGVQLISKALADSATLPLRIFVVWMHVTVGDRHPPNSLVLLRIPDQRAEQWWDPHRLIAKAMLRDYPPDTGLAMADTSGAGPPLIWNFVALWRPGVTWNERVPLPDFSGHPIEEYVERFRRRASELSRRAAK